MKHRVKIELNTLSDVIEFVGIINKLHERDSGPIHLTNGVEYKVNAKSLLGCIASMEWNNLYVESDFDLYSHVSKFASME